MSREIITESVHFRELFQVKHGFAFKGQFFSDKPGDVILTPGNFLPSGGLQFREGKDRSYQSSYPEEFLLSAGDMLVVMTDLTQEARILGSPALVPSGICCLHNQRLGKVVELDSKRLDRGYLYYLMCDPEYRLHLKATATGSTVKHTSPGRIGDFLVHLPNLAYQKRIALILAAYDDLIEVNRRRVAILEEMARRLFEEWFVHLRFPGHVTVPVHDTPEGSSPEGWRSGTFGELVSEMRDTVRPSMIDNLTPYVGLEHIPRRSTTLSEYGTAGGVVSAKLRFERSDILFGKIRPYFHKVAVAPFAGVCSTDAIVLRPRSSQVAGLATAIASSDGFVAHAVQTSNGTKMPRANWTVLARYPVRMPPDELLRRYNAVAVAWIDQAIVLTAANARLVAARDLLLPRLISGDLSLADALAPERLLEAAD